MPESSASPAAGLTDGFRLELGGAFPLEGAIQAVAEYARTRNENMDADLRRRIDQVLVQSIEDLHYVWRKLWVRAGVLQELTNAKP